MELLINHTTDFEVTGRGDAAEWQNTGWENLRKVGSGPAAYATRFKTLWSNTGLYCLFDADDKLLTTTMTEDNANLWEEDVIEVFLWPNEEQILYFEYEISPMNFELPILVPNNNGRFKGWLPWNYDGDRRIRKATSARGGEKKSGARVDGWVSEFFIPFSLFYGLGNCPPVPGTKWRANFYRIDHDDGHTQWAWCTDTGGNFHDFEHFGTVSFGG